MPFPSDPPSPFVRALDSPHRIVAMLEFKGNMYVATEHRVYTLINGALRSMVFEITGAEKT